MAKKNLTLIALILDRTGSMQSIKDDVIGGFNQFVKEQQEEKGEATMLMAQFDSQDPYEVIYDMKDIQDVEELTDKTYVPRGSTPLLDAIGRGINDVAEKIGKMAKRSQPAKVILAVMTDGAENASREFNLKTIKKMVEEKQKDGWQFAFLGANLDSFGEAGSMGMAQGTAMNYDHSALGTKQAYTSMSQAISSYRGASIDVTSADDYKLFDDEDSKAASK